MQTTIMKKAKNISCLICDVDGVLTDGSLHFDNQGNELKTFHVQDGMGLKLLMHADIRVAVITSSHTPAINHRMQQLGIRDYFTGQVNKLAAFLSLKEQYSLQNEEIAYIGDDLPDIPIIQQVGLGIAVKNAVIEVKESAIWHTQNTGGKGAVREVCDLILKAKDVFSLALERYLCS